MQSEANGEGPLRLRVWGERACFTRPEMKVERVSYDAMTPSAARGVLEAILWRPEFRWVVRRIDVLKPIRWDSVRRNEVSEKVSLDEAEGAMRAGRGRLGLIVEEKRQQRAGVVLRDVAYVVHAAIGRTAKAAEEDTLVKYREMFKRRARAGQCFHRPYLGCREFSADFVLLEGEAPEPIVETKDLGWMLHDFVYGGGRPDSPKHRLAARARIGGRLTGRHQREPRRKQHVEQLLAPVGGREQAALVEQGHQRPPAAASTAAGSSAASAPLSPLPCRPARRSPSDLRTEPGAEAKCTSRRPASR
ncbi:MAG: type I-C CRISPR-associated protein Cas5 [Proteobacteria bacterium]|nr:type I-C CRISPR-associated protein Cas5 [Pseudomonadota bacterium]